MNDFEADIAPTFTCPHCGGSVTIGVDASGERFTCPHCGGDFSVPGPDEAMRSAEDDDENDASPDRSRDDELDELRIRQLAAARRATYRARSYAVIAFSVCQIAAIQLVMLAVSHARSLGWDWWPTMYVLIAVVCQVMAVYFLRQTVALHREAKRSVLSEPTTTPDFTPLRDGSQRWDNLDRM